MMQSGQKLCKLYKVCAVSRKGPETEDLERSLNENSSVSTLIWSTTLSCTVEKECKDCCWKQWLNTIPVTSAQLAIYLNQSKVLFLILFCFRLLLKGNNIVHSGSWEKLLFSSFVLHILRSQHHNAGRVPLSSNVVPLRRLPQRFYFSQEQLTGSLGKAEESLSAFWCHFKDVTVFFL